MKLWIIVVLSICLKPASSFAIKLVQDTNQDEQSEHSYQYFDSLSVIADSLGNYRDALEINRQALDLSKTNQDWSKESYYHLKLAKYYYLTGNTDEALTEFRLYALVKETETEFEKNLEIVSLENAYLEEMENLLREMDMDKRLIKTLQEENEVYFNAQQKIMLAIKIGFGAVLFIIALILYNRYVSKKNKVKEYRQEAEDLQRLKAQVEKLDLELKRNDTDLARMKETQQQSLSYARNIQLSLLPSGIDLGESIDNSFVLHIPRDIISGDFYAVHSSGDKTVLAIFDCPGHGVNAAHSTVVTNNLFRSIVSQGITAPSMILTMLDQKLKHEIQQLGTREEMISGVKMAICTINGKTKELEYSGAQFPLFYVHLDDLHFVGGNRFPIGDPLFSDKFYSSSNIRLSTGDMVYLSTDGYYNQLGGRKNKKFLRTSLINLLKSIFSQEVKEQKFILEKVFQEWKSREGQTDDVLVLGFRV